MSGNATITAFGSTSIAATSPDTQNAIAAALLAVNATPQIDRHTWDGLGTPPATTHAGSALILNGPVPAGFAIPAGYTTVIVPGGSGPITGGDAGTTIVGDGINYTGHAGHITSGSGDSNISDDTAGAVVMVGSIGSATVSATGANAVVDVGDSGTAVVSTTGADASVNVGRGANTTINASGAHDTVSIGGLSSVTLTASGNGDTINIASDASGSATLTGTGDVVNIGGGFLAPHEARLGAASAPAINNRINDAGGGAATFNITSPFGVNLVQLGAADTVNASAGISTIFGLSADSVSTGLGSVFFVGGSVASTILGGASNATVFSTSGDEFNVGAAQANVFVGGAAASTVNAGAGGGSFFGGTHGDDYNFGTGTSQVFVGLGGADTLSGGTGAVAPVIFAIGAEHMTLTGGTPPVTIVSFANGGVIDTSSTTGNNVVFAGYGVGGNQTLIGTAAGTDTTTAAPHDTFIAGANPAGAATTMTIDNWHGGDVFYLAGFTAADNTTMHSAIAADLGKGAAGDLSFTLSDKTTITFVGHHPTNSVGNSAF